jgi:hypothetical protein
MGMETVNDYASFQLTNNSKVRFFDGHNNTFSLTQGPPEEGGTCPMATSGEGGCLKVCYDKNLRKLYKKYAAVEDANTLKVVDASVDRMYQVIKNTVMKWLLNGGKEKPYFRIHTGGDFFSEAYASAWAKVIEETSEVRFWAFTRSLFAVPILAECKNLTLMLSCDPVNKEKMLAVYSDYREYPNVAIAWMGGSFPEEVNDRPQLDCPEVTGKIKKLKDIGACARCRVCVDRPLKSGKTRHVRFPVHR